MNNKLEKLNACVLLPTYNNAGTLQDVITEVLEFVPENRLLIVNDGSTDATQEILSNCTTAVTILKHTTNKGKGAALRLGFHHAIEKGFQHVVTMDSDGQHFPEDIETLVDKALEHPNSVIMGSRNMEQDGVPKKSSFGNKFSNFWFKVETGISLPDTQTGFRIYPLEPLSKMKLYTSKFELEIEVIVRLAWKGVAFHPVPVQVTYDAENRVSHFRPAVDFIRISVLNTILVLLSLFVYYPKKLFSWNTLRAIKKEAIKPQETNKMKALSLAFGVFMGIIPIWGFQLLIGIPLAIFFRMNKVLFVTAANISIPPMIPFIVYTSLLFGQKLMDGEVNHERIFTFTNEAIKSNLWQYIIGACLLAVTAFVVVYVVSYGLLKLFRKEPEG